MEAYRYVFALRLRELRERRGINRKTLAELVGLSKNMVAKYERGKRFPSVETLVRLADFFDVPIDSLLRK